MLTISYRGRPALHVAGDCACFADWAVALEPDHPVRRWIACMGFFALDVLDGHQAGPYTTEAAERFARGALMPACEFRALAGHDDAVLAEHFNVPLEQVAARRREVLRVAGS